MRRKKNPKFRKLSFWMDMHPEGKGFHHCCSSRAPLHLCTSFEEISPGRPPAFINIPEVDPFSHSCPPFEPLWTYVAPFWHKSSVEASTHLPSRKAESSQPYPNLSQPKRSQIPILSEREARPQRFSCWVANLSSLTFLPFPNRYILGRREAMPPRPSC